jgi:hypothetical protein
MADGFLDQLKLVREINPEIQTFVDNSAHTAGPNDLAKFLEWNPYVTVWCPVWHRPDEVIDLYRENGADHMWMYFCGMHQRHVNPSWRYRKHAWLGKSRQVKGLMFWYSFGGDELFDGAATAAFFDNSQGVFTSRRWEAWRDGIEDYQYFTLLESLADKAQPDERKAAMKLLADSVTEVLQLDDKYKRDMSASPTGPGQTAAEANAYEDARERIAKQIIRLQKQDDK